MYFGLESGHTMLLLLIGIIVTMSAQFKINKAFKKYLNIRANSGLTGADIARKILEKNGLSNIYVVETNGYLSSHYDPSRKTVRLEKNIYEGSSIAAISVAAHEVGHAIQDKENYSFMIIRSKLVPLVNLVSYLGYFSLFISIFGGLTSYLMLSIIVLLATILFQLVTLPVEFDASSRAKKELEKLNLVNNEEVVGVSKMLNAAAFTYVASLATSLLQLLRLVLIFSNNDD